MKAGFLDKLIARLDRVEPDRDGRDRHRKWLEGHCVVRRGGCQRPGVREH